MADHKGDDNKRPEHCIKNKGRCENLKCTYEGFDGERYGCEVCGESYYLDYGDMK